MIEDYMAVQPQSELISSVHKRYLAEQIVLGMREGKILDTLLPKGSGDLKFPTKGDTLDLKVKRSLQRFDEDEAEIPAIQERKLEKFLENSAVQQPVFRAISFNPEYDWDARFAMRNEVGPHYGSEGQANYIAMQSILGMRPQELLMNITTRRPDQPKMVPFGSKELEEVGQPLMDRAEFNNIYEIHRKARSLGWNPTKYDPDESKLASLAMSNQIPELDNSFLFKAILNMKQNDVPPTIYKGYLSIKNPLLLDDGTWTAEDFFTDYTTTKVSKYFYKKSPVTIMDEIVQRVASETGQSLDSIRNNPAYLDMEQSASRTKDFTDLLSEEIEPGDFGDFGGFNQFDIVNQVYLDLQRASTNRKFVEFLESYGYDGIAYPNKAEPAFADDEEILSYIPFRPEQFKLESAFDFDVDDPRMFMAEGGVAPRSGIRRAAVRRMAKGGKVDKKKMACNKPKRTPNHPKKSHVVKACKDGKEKIIRFGEQGAKTAGKPKAGESKRMKAKRKSFKARHRKNIKKGNMSAAYWADKVKW